jgi:Fic family protein
LAFKLRSEADLEALTEEVMKSSEIEAEILDRDQVRSSIARRLGVDIGTLTPADSKVEGVVEMLFDATGNNRAPLGAERLFGWYAALFPAGRSSTTRITIGQWRTDATDPMQVICGRVGLECVHYQAPAAEALAAQMKALIDWFSADQDLDPCARRARPVSRSSRSILSTTAMDTSLARSPTCSWRGRRRARSASTACPNSAGP